MNSRKPNKKQNHSVTSDFVFYGKGADRHNSESENQLGRGEYIFGALNLVKFGSTHAAFIGRDGHLNNLPLVMVVYIA